MGLERYWYFLKQINTHFLHSIPVIKGSLTTNSSPICCYRMFLTIITWKPDLLRISFLHTQVCFTEDSYIIRRSSHVTRIKQNAYLRELGLLFCIFSCECQNFDMMKFQLSFVDCFTADVSVIIAWELNFEWERLFQTFLTWFRRKNYLGRPG